MKFSIKDRLLFVQRLEDDKSLLGKMIKDSLHSKLSLSINEIVNNNVRETQNGIEWDNIDEPVDILLLEPELKLLRPIVENMDDNGEIDFSNIDLCSQIMG